MRTSHQALESRAGGLLSYLVALSLQSPSRVFEHRDRLVKGCPLPVATKSSQWLFQWRDYSINLLRLELEMPDDCRIYYPFQGVRRIPWLVPVTDMTRFLVSWAFAVTRDTQVIWLTRVTPQQTWHSVVTIWLPLIAGQPLLAEDFVVEHVG